MLLARATTDMTSAKALAIGLALTLGVGATKCMAQEQEDSGHGGRVEASPQAAERSEQAMTPAVEPQAPAEVEAPRQASDRDLRILSEVVGGVLAEGVAIGAGFTTAIALKDRVQGSGVATNVAYGLVVFSALDLVLFPLGVTIGGGLAGGNGGYGWSFLGHLAGAVGGVIVGFGVIDPGKDLILPLSIEVLAALTGAILGYELSHEDPSDEPAPSSPLRSAPSVMLLGGGRATLGVSGAF